MLEERVVEQLQRDGTFDELRQQVVNALLADNSRLASHVRERARQSAAVKTISQRKSKRELFDEVRQEIEAEVMNQASAAAWRILTDLHSSDVAFNIADKVEEVEYSLAYTYGDDEAVAQETSKQDGDLVMKTEEEEGEADKEEGQT